MRFCEFCVCRVECRHSGPMRSRLTQGASCAMVTRNSPKAVSSVGKTSGHSGRAYGGRMRTLRFLLSNVLLLLVIGVLVPVMASAQTGAGSLTGIVSDQSGAAVPGATVSAINQATHVPYTAVSNETGNYTLTSLPV